MQKDLAILHPLPRVMKYKDDDDPRALYFQQVNVNVCRMALIINY
ncbi:MAG: hypothetical protein ACLTA5_05595 [Anaerococcus obesiensis]